MMTWLIPLAAAPQDGLAEIAAGKRSAALKLSEDGPGLKRYGLGVFISEDGLALVNLNDLALGTVPAIITPDGTELPLGTILGIFPLPELALVKFNHKPKVWTPIAAKEPEVGERIAIAALCADNSWSETIPPVVGSVMSKHSTLGGNGRALEFDRKLSLGASFSRRQQASFAQASFAVNGRGELVAVKAGVSLEEQQMFIYLSPVTGLTKQIAEMVKAGKAIPFPLPDASNPIDPVLQDPAYHNWDKAMQRGDEAAVRKHLADLRQRYPKNRRIHSVPGLPPLTEDGKPVADLADFPALAATAPRGEQVRRLLDRAKFLAQKGNFKDAVREITAAQALAPKDYPEVPELLAFIQNRLGQPIAAEASLRAAYAIRPEFLGVVITMGNMLTQQGKLDEAEKFTKRRREVERIYWGL